VTSMHRAMALALLLLILPGCAPKGIPPLESNPPANGAVHVYSDGTASSYNSSFDAVRGTFSYWTVAVPDHPLDSTDAEAWRMRNLEGALSDHRMCARGYEVVSRKPKILNSSQTLILYEGHCN
jgi:hypothetical protein